MLVMDKDNIILGVLFFFLYLAVSIIIGNPKKDSGMNKEGIKTHEKRHDIYELIINYKTFLIVAFAVVIILCWVYV